MGELVQGINGKGSRLQSRIWFFSLVDEENDIPKILDNLSKCSAIQVFTILHDKDVIRQDDGSIIHKRNHHHFALRFESPTQLTTVANIFDLDPSSYHLVQRAKNFKASCRYLLHLDQKDKHQYDVSELQAIKGTKDDYYNIAIGKAQYVTSDADLFPNFGKFDIQSYKDQYLEIYNNIDDNKRRNLILKELKQSYANYIEKRKYEMESKNVVVMFLEGATGTGKSTMAKNLAISNEKTYCISSSSNDVMQDYTDQDYLILDDLRDTSFSFEDLLKLLDNYVISSVKSRYNNKLFLGDHIIITSAKPLSEWYKDTKEDRRQLFRRISMFGRCRVNNNSLVCDIFMGDNGKAVDDNGYPVGTSFPYPIIEITKNMVRDIKQLWKNVGVDPDNYINTDQISIFSKNSK